MTAYDELGMLEDNAREVALEWRGPPAVRREAVDVGGGRAVSALVWGPEGAGPEVVMVHGGAQNAHTWDTVALALDRPLVAVDLPGHGHSDWRADHEYSPTAMADDLAVAIRALAPEAGLVVGMSLGGLTAMCLAAGHPELVRKLLVVDVTPGTDHAKAEPIIAFISGPESFASFDEMLQRTIEHNPARSESSLRRGVLHNAREEPDGSWTWRWDPVRNWAGEERADFGSLWDVVEAIEAPMMLARGGAWSVVGDEDVEELLKRQPSCQVVTVDGAGHSIQGDKPLDLARIIADFARSS